MCTLQKAREVAVHKFGGSSLSTSLAYKHVSSIIQKHCLRYDWVVVSAAGNTTNRLLAIFTEYTENPRLALVLLEELFEYQKRLLDEVENATKARLLSQLKADFRSLTNRIKTSYDTHNNAAEWVCFGELWSARLLSSMIFDRFNTGVMVDARQLICLDEGLVDLRQCKVNLDTFQTSAVNGIYVMTGFIASDRAGRTNTLGRNGSDYSAALIARLLNAKSLYFWTDVEGIYSADPRFVNDAVLIPEISRFQMQLLAQSGNTVLHPKTLRALESMGSDIVIKSSMKPQGPGTVVSVAFDKNISLLSRTKNIGWFAQQLCEAIACDHIAFYLPEKQGRSCVVLPEYLSEYELCSNDCKVVDLLIYFGARHSVQEYLDEHDISYSVYDIQGEIPFTVFLIDNRLTDLHYEQLHTLVCSQTLQDENQRHTVLELLA